MLLTLVVAKQWTDNGANEIIGDRVYILGMQVNRIGFNVFGKTMGSLF